MEGHTHTVGKVESGCLVGRVGQGPWNVNVPESPGGPGKPLAGPPPGFTSGRSGVGPENGHPSWGLLSASLGTSPGEPRVSPGAGAVCLLP